jgi:uncharacterized protein YuzE
MTIKYDKDIDAIYVVFSDDKIVETQEEGNGVLVDYNDKDEVVAVEMLNVKSNDHKIDLPFVLKSA